jgi:hypothetical protein
MTRSLTRVASRIVSAFAALATSAMLFTAAAGHAQAPGPYYVATPIAAPAKPDLVINSSIWTLQGSSFVANKAPERDLVMCQQVAQRAGKLNAFSANGTALDADSLAKCNARAK